MALHNMLFSEGNAVLGSIDPGAKTAATYTTGWVDMSIWAKFAGLVIAGTLGASATVAAKLEQATSSGGAGAKDVTSKAITGLTQTPTDNSSSQQWINCRADELDIANNFRYARLSITVGTATSGASGLLLGTDCKFGPASDHDAATVTQYIS